VLYKGKLVAKQADANFTTTLAIAKKLIDRLKGQVWKTDFAKSESLENGTNWLPHC
jgi:hypothetical protein